MPEMQIEISQDGAVRTVTLNRPAALNAFTTPMLVQLRQALEDAAADKAVRCVVTPAQAGVFVPGRTCPTR